MAFTLRQESHAGFTTATGALTYKQGDDNFTGLYERDDLKLALTGGTLTGALNISSGNFDVTSGLILSGGTDIATLWGGGGGGATDLDGLTDVEVTLGAGHAGSAYQYNIFMANGASVGAVPSHGTLSDARANIGMGGYALAALTSGDYNIGIGLRACWKVATTTQNVGIGYSALMNTTGSGNTAIGYDAGGSTSSGGFNTFLGASAYGVNTSSRQISIGYGSVAGGNDTFALGYLNKTLLHGEYVTGGQTKLGINLGNTYQAPTATLHVKGGGVTFTDVPLLIEDSNGIQLMKLRADGRNVLIGHNAGDAINAAGMDNILLGYKAGELISTGTDNVLIGKQVKCKSNSAQNFFVGNQAGSITCGSGNIAFGYISQWYNNGGHHNISLGYQSALNLTSGSYNILLGWNTGGVVATGSNNIVIGKDLDVSGAAISDELNIGGNIIGSMTAADRYTTFIGQAYSPTATLTSSASITPQFRNGNVFTVDLAHNATLNDPDEMKDGGTYIIIVKQTGSFTLGYGTAYKWEGGSAPTITTGAGTVDILTFVSDGTVMYSLKAQNFS